MANVSLTWLGHAGFRLDGSSGKRVYIDPWLDNPKIPASEKEIERIDVLALTHGHSDHSGSAVDIYTQHSPTVVCMLELADWLGSKGVEAEGFNKGGTIDVDGVRVTMTDAHHSSSTPDGTYAGEPAGLVVELDGTRVYHAEDTGVGRIYEPDALPIWEGSRRRARRSGRHLCLRRHAADRPDLRARRRDPSHRRSLHHGTTGSRRRTRASRRETLRSLPLRDLPASHRDA